MTGKVREFCYRKPVGTLFRFQCYFNTSDQKPRPDLIEVKATFFVLEDSSQGQGSRSIDQSIAFD